MKGKKLVIGMPAGSLADPKRGGNLVDLLEDAGFTTSGYESGGPTRFPYIGYLYGWDGRPQEFGSQLHFDELDIAIAGDDWVRERSLELKYEYNREVKLKKVLSLQRGSVRIVAIVDSGGMETDWKTVLTGICKQQSVIRIVSEMPYMAVDWMKRCLAEIGMGEEFPDFSVQKYTTPPKVKNGFVVYETWGKTEAKITGGGADLGLEITQTGSAIRNYGLTVIDTLMESETGIWTSESAERDPEKQELVEMFLLNLYGTINAENKILLLFNVPKEKIERVEQYLKDYNLYGDEPTINPGKNYSEYSIQLDVTDTENPISEVRYRLAKLGAKSIDTVPLASSIPGIEHLHG
jgi:ATP phosphoribosyltransferase